MSGAKSNYLAAALAQLYAGGVAYSAPGHVYLALCTTLPTATSTGSTIVETDYGSYARTQVGSNNDQTTGWNAASGETVTNKNAITFPAATGPSTNPIVGVALVDASTNGNVLVWASVTSTAIATGDTPIVNATALSITEA